MRQFLLFHPFGDIFAIGVKSIQVVVCTEHVAVVFHTLFEFVAGIFIGPLIHIFIGAICKNGGDFIPLGIVGLHIAVIPHQRLDFVCSKDGCIYIFPGRVRMSFQVRQYILRHTSNPLVIVVGIGNIDVVPLAILRVI